jgi:hypothetical protein
MNWSTELKAKAKEHTLSLLVALIGLLLGAIWAAVPSEIWGKVSEAIPKRALWSVIGLLVLGLFSESAYILLLRKRLAEKMTTKFGVKWTKDLVPHCPSCSAALTSYGQYDTGFAFSSVWGFKCVKCDALIVMNDDEGNTLELKAAKQLLAAKSGKSQQTEDDEVISEIEEQILVQMARKSKGGVTEAEMTYFLRQHPERVTFILGQMEKNNYIYSICTMLGHNDPIKYYLSDKGRAILINKNLI